VEKGAVLENAGEEVCDGAAGGEENERSPDRRDGLISAVDEVPSGSEEEGGAESPSEDRESRTAADGAGRNVAEVVDEGDEARPEVGLLVAEEGTLEAGAEALLTDDVDVGR